MKRIILFTALGFIFLSAHAQTSAELLASGIDKKDNGDCDGALEDYASALRINSDNKIAAYEAGWCLNDLERYTEAVTYLKRAIAIDATLPKFHFELGLAYNNLEQQENAIAEYKTAFDLKPDYYSALEEIAFIYYNLGDYENAYTYFTRYLISENNPDAIDYYKTGWSANELEKYADAIYYLEKYAPDNTPDLAKKFAEIGYANYKLDKGDASVSAYLTSLSYMPDYGSALRGIGDTYYEILNNYPQAIYYYEKAIAADRESSEYLYYDLGWLYNDAGRYSDAVLILISASDINPDNVKTRVELGFAEYMIGENDNAIMELIKAVSLDPNSKLGYYYMGLTYIAMEKKSDAMDAYYKLKAINAEQAEKLLGKINQ